MLIDEYLNEDHTHVLWIDADVVDIDPDIIEKLLNISQDSVVAPYVFLEDNNYWPYKRFYDLSCFIDANGEEFNYFPLYNRDSRDKKAEVQSVGTCFLAPAHIHRSIKYDPFSEEIEHVDFFSKARAKGIKIYTDPSIEIRHAFLPKYGESFH
jgi:GT2 family glycosyltransferase